MWISRLCVQFLFYSFVGWIYETIFCMVRRRRWENRGFLFGPICPIYGVGAVTVTLLISFLPTSGALASPWAVFFISMFGSAVLEYATSWTLERLFHAIWWDYSNLPLNLHGRISLFSSIGFGCAGVLIVFVVAPYMEGISGLLPAIWAEFLSLLGIAILAADLTLTVSALTDFAARVYRLEDSMNGHMDHLVDSAWQKAADAKDFVLTGSEQVRARLETMSRTSQLALRRVESFRFPGLESERIHAALKELRERFQNRLDK